MKETYEWSGTNKFAIPREVWRYYFAGQALAGLCANPEKMKESEEIAVLNFQEGKEVSHKDVLAHFAEEAADALLAALEKEPREGGETDGDT